MREIIEDVRRWYRQDEPIALATVVQTWGSAPRRAGAKMAITASGQLSGSVSGGCVEGAVAEEAFAVLETGQPKLLHYGVADEDGWEVGLACGGNIDIFVEPLDRATFATVDQLLTTERTGVIVTVIGGSQELLGRKLIFEHAQKQVHGSIDASIDATVLEMTSAAVQQRTSASVTLPDPKAELFLDVLLPPPTLVMVGGVHIAITLSELAKTMGYRTVVIDPRHAFGNVERFPHVDQLIHAWPQEAFAQITPTESTAVAILTHDPKIDDPALHSVLGSPAFYIGALGSRNTHAGRVQRLQEDGYSDAEIAAIHGPIGLNIHAQTPDEIALAIMAEIVQARNRQPE